jgi:hypothetical protein
MSGRLGVAFNFLKDSGRGRRGRRGRRNVLQQFDESVKGERKQRSGTQYRQIDQHRAVLVSIIHNAVGLVFALRTQPLRVQPLMRPSRQPAY